MQKTRNGNKESWYLIKYKTYNAFQQKAYIRGKIKAERAYNGLKKIKHVTEISEPERIRQKGENSSMKRKIGDEVIVMTRLTGKITDVLDGAYKVNTPVGELTLSEKYVWGLREVQLPKGVDEYTPGKYRARYQGKFLGSFDTPKQASDAYKKAKGDM